MEPITSHEFCTRNVGPFPAPWTVFRFYDQKVAQAKFEEISSRPDIEVSELRSHEIKDGFIVLWAGNTPHVEVDTTGLECAGTVTRHYATGTEFTDWYCPKENLDAIRERLRSLQTRENLKVSC